MGLPKLKIMSWNVRGLSDPIRRRRLKEALKEEDWDIYFMLRDFNNMFQGYRVFHGVSREGRGYTCSIVKENLKMEAAQMDKEGI